MSHSYAVLGAGRQGVAIAYDLLKNGDAARVVLTDSDEAVLSQAADRLKALLPAAASKLDARRSDASDATAVRDLLRGIEVAISAVPYRFNVALTDAAIAAGTSLCDLGGNTDVVRQQLSRHEAARKAGVSIVPDCGLCPGLGNHLAAYGITLMDEPEHVHVRCGGLPQQKVGPLSYKLVFNFQGLVNEYSGLAEFLRDGQIKQVPTLTELEEIEFPAPVGKCEAAVTSGGTSTCPESFRSRLKTYDYKTVRYPGHFAVIRAMFELGFFEERVALRDGQTIQPKPLTQALFEDRLSFPDTPDLVVLRVIVTGRHAGKPHRVEFNVLDYQDPKTGFTAMERTTGFPAALVALMQARKDVKPGAIPLELSVPARAYYEELQAHGVNIVRSET